MDELQRAAHKFEQEANFLIGQIERAETRSPVALQLAVAQAKKVRAASIVLLRALARERDQATAQEGTSDEQQEA